MAMADGVVLEMIEQTILTPAVIEDAIERLVGMVQQPGEDAAERADKLRASIERLEAEVGRHGGDRRRGRGANARGRPQ